MKKVLALTALALVMMAVPASAAAVRTSQQGGCHVHLKGEAPQLRCWGAGRAQVIYRYPGQVIQAHPPVEWESFGNTNPDLRVLVKGSRVVIRLVGTSDARVLIWDVNV